MNMYIYSCNIEKADLKTILVFMLSKESFPMMSCFYVTSRGGMLHVRKWTDLRRGSD